MKTMRQADSLKQAISSIPYSFGRKTAPQPIRFKAEQFHPDIRAEFQAEVDKLNRLYPPMEGCAVMMQCCDSNDEFQDSENAAYTRTSDASGYIVITFNPYQFGPKADLAATRAIMEGAATKGQGDAGHGSMTAMATNVWHEYGHAVEHMIRYHGAFFAGPTTVWGKRIQKPFHEFGHYWNVNFAKLADWSESFSAMHGGEDEAQAYMDSLTPRQRAKTPGPWQWFPTAYSASAPHEFFAECFALTRWGNAKELAEKPVKLMAELLKAVYPASVGA